MSSHTKLLDHINQIQNMLTIFLLDHIVGIFQIYFTEFLTQSILLRIVKTS
jgi:hypothetical protein